MIAHWLLAIRPKTLTLAVAPVIAATALGYGTQGSLSLLPLLATVLAAVLIQIGTNLHNDVADFERGTDAPGRAGPRRATAEGWFTAAQVRRGAYGAFLGAFALGIYLVWLGGWPIMAIGLASIAAGLAYTGGLRPIAYTALGELFVFLFFGLAAVAGSFYLQTLQWGAPALLLGALLGMPAAAVLTVNNFRDLDSDRLTGKLTLVHYLGRPLSRGFYALLMLLPFPLSLSFASLGVLHGVWLWLPWLLLPEALRLVWRFARETPGPAFNRLLAGTARLQLLLALLFSIALSR